jgi:5S rRNA maturation endonuclease (ribonuclease M5)
MKYNPRLKLEIDKYKNYVILVEGKKDAKALEVHGFDRVFPIHKTGVSPRERMEQILSITTKKDKICILTDLDKNGKKLYMHVKPILQELGAKIDNNFRGILIRAKISHIEGIGNFLSKVEEI